MRRIAIAFVTLSLTAVAVAVAGVLTQTEPRAWTIVGAQLADGSGRPLRPANVRIAGGRIVAVGSVDARPGDAVVDAKGLVVSPGFIDIHNHSSGELAGDPAAESQVAQGITTVVLGPDGSSPWPIGEYLAERRQNPAAVNVTADAYPYSAWSSTITVLVPDRRYDYPPSVERALADVGGAANVLIVRHAAHPEYEFRTLDAVARDRTMTPVDLFMQIVK